MSRTASKKQRPLRRAVVSEAEALYRANGGKAIELTIAFDPRAPITPLQRKLLPPELATLAKHIDSSPASSEVERWHFRNMPEISSVYLSTREYPDAEWRITRVLRRRADVSSGPGQYRQRQGNSARRITQARRLLASYCRRSNGSLSGTGNQNRRHQRRIARVRENHRLQTRLRPHRRGEIVSASLPRPIFAKSISLGRRRLLIADRFLYLIIGRAT